MSSEKNSETKPTASDSTPSSTPAAAASSVNKMTNSLVYSKDKNGKKNNGSDSTAMVIRDVARTSYSVSNVITAAINLKDAQDRLEMAEREVAKSNLVLQIAKQAHKALETEKNHVHEAEESTMKHKAEAIVRAENARQMDIYVIDEADPNETIAVSQQKREVVSKYMVQCEKNFEIPVEVLSAILSNNSMFAQRQRYNGSAPVAAPQPKGPSI